MNFAACGLEFVVRLAIPFIFLRIDIPLAFVLVSPCLRFASTRQVRNAPLVVPAVMLFVLGISSPYVAFTESSSTVSAFQNQWAAPELLQHLRDLRFLTLSPLRCQPSLTSRPSASSG